MQVESWTLKTTLRLPPAYLDFFFIHGASNHEELVFLRNLKTWMVGMKANGFKMWTNFKKERFNLKTLRFVDRPYLGPCFVYFVWL